MEAIVEVSYKESSNYFSLQSHMSIVPSTLKLLELLWRYMITYLYYWPLLLNDLLTVEVIIEVIVVACKFIA